MKRMMRLILPLLASALLVTACGAPEISKQPQQAVYSDVAEASVEAGSVARFIDDDGREIVLAGPCERIISLYSAHTENLFELGAGENVLGVHDTSVYPPEAAKKPQFSYNGDPETVIAAEPDCVLIRPFIRSKAPDFVAALENAGIRVVSLFPDGFEGFDEYIEKLGMIVGRQEEAKASLALFHSELDFIEGKTSKIPQAERQGVFFEATEENMRTAAPGSMPALAMELAGGINIAADAKPIKAGSAIASFGPENILMRSDAIDVYLSQKGVMSAGGSAESIMARPGFGAIKAVQRGRVFVMDEKLISSPTFRFVKGVRQLARYLYPELFDDVSEYAVDLPAKRRDLAQLIVLCRHLPLYAGAKNDSPHEYGGFADVPWTDPQFDAIETVAMSGYMGWEDAGGAQRFYPDAPVTAEELQETLDAIGIKAEVSAPPTCAQIADLLSQ